MSYGYVIKVIITKVVEAVILMLIVGFVGFNLTFLGFDSNQLNGTISLLAPIAGIIFAAGVGGFTLNAARECGGIFSRMYNFQICGLISWINLALFLIAAYAVFPMIFSNNFVAAPFLGIDYSYWIIGFALVWWLFLVFKYMDGAESL